jgi:hypothetical protein
MSIWRHEKVTIFSSLSYFLWIIFPSFSILLWKCFCVSEIRKLSRLIFFSLILCVCLCQHHLMIFYLSVHPPAFNVKCIHFRRWCFQLLIIRSFLLHNHTQAHAHIRTLYHVDVETVMMSFRIDMNLWLSVVLRVQ